MFAILVQPGSEAYGVGKTQTHDAARLASHGMAGQQAKPVSFLDCSEGNAVSCFGFEPE